MKPESEQQERTGPHDPNLLNAVGGYHNRRRPGWYMALVLLGFGLGAVLALAVSSSMQSSSLDRETGKVPDAELSVVREGLSFGPSEKFAESTPDMFEAGISAVYVHFRLPGVVNAKGLSGSVRLDGKEFAALDKDSFIGKTDNGLFVGHAVLRGPQGHPLEKGIYEVEVKAADGAIYEGSFVVVVNSSEIAAQVASRHVGMQISDASMCTGTTQLGEPQTRRTTFADDEDRICLAFHFTNAQRGSAVKVEWLYADEVIRSGDSEIVLDAEEGWAYAWIRPEPKSQLLPGAYHAVVRAIPSGEVLVSEPFVVTPRSKAQN